MLYLYKQHCSHKWMQSYTLKCPNCDGDLEVEDEIDTFFANIAVIKLYLVGKVMRHIVRR